MTDQTTTEPDNVVSRPRFATETTTEYAVRYEDGIVWPRPDRAAAELTIRALQGRHGTATLVARQVTHTPWTEETPKCPS